MGDATALASVPALVLLVGLLAVGSAALTRRVAVPAPAFLLIGAAVAVRIVPGVRAPADATVERIVTVALAAILLDGGMRIGWSRFRAEGRSIALTGLAGTALTIVGTAVVAHLVVGVDGYLSLLVATAIAPTDPAVVFSVLGKRVAAGGAGTILAGESGVNDPVGIAFMAALLGAGHLGRSTVADVGTSFLSAMAFGVAIGVVGGGALRLLLIRWRRVGGRLAPVLTAAGAVIVYVGAALAHGSGFLAVLLAGIVLGDQRGRSRQRLEQFHAAAAGIGEIVVFAILGLTVDLAELTRVDVWLPGIVLGAVVAVAVRPALVGACLLPVQLPGSERTFVLFSGLKGAVPLLLGLLLVSAHVPGAARLYGIVIVVVVFSIVVQGTFVPFLAAALHLPAGGRPGGGRRGGPAGGGDPNPPGARPTPLRRAGPLHPAGGGGPGRRGRGSGGRSDRHR